MVTVAAAELRNARRYNPGPGTLVHHHNHHQTSSQQLGCGLRDQQTNPKYCIVSINLVDIVMSFCLTYYSIIFFLRLLKSQNILIEDVGI